MATKKMDLNDLLRQIYDKASAVEKKIVSLEGQKQKVYLASAGPDEPLSIILLEDVSEILPCFDECDALYHLPDSPIMMSYCPAEMIHLPGKQYLTGAAVFFRLNEDYEIISLRLEDICRIAEFLSERDTALMADGMSFNGICLD